MPVSDQHPERSHSDGLPLTITEAARGLRTRAWSAVELLDMVLRRVETLDPLLNVFAADTFGTALVAARAADADFASGVDRGPLQGIPLAVKDVLATADAPTRANSAVMRQPFFQGRDAPVVSRLRAAGSTLVGKTATMEFALGAPDPAAGQLMARNPFNTDRWTGGTSTGTGAGISAGLFLGGLGSDTAGSIRIPAAMCGITGFRPTYGTVPTTGMVPLSWSQDTVGPMARSARDCALVLSVIADTNVELDAPRGSLSGIRIGIDHTLTDASRCDADVGDRMYEALSVLTSMGAQVVSVTLPHYEEMSTVSTLLMCSEALTFHRTMLQSHWSLYGPDTRASLALGALTSSTDYIQSQHVRQAVSIAMDDIYSQVDVVASPTTLTHAPPLEGLDLGAIVSVITTQYWSALGSPAVSIPMGLTSAGLPVGLQIAGRPFADVEVLRLADTFQRQTDFHLQEAPLISEQLT